MHTHTKAFKDGLTSTSFGFQTVREWSVPHSGRYSAHGPRRMYKEGQGKERAVVGVRRMDGRSNQETTVNSTDNGTHQINHRPKI